MQICEGCGIRGNHAKLSCHKSGEHGRPAHPDSNKSDKPWAQSVNGIKWKKEGFDNIVEERLPLKTLMDSGASFCRKLC